MMPSKGQASEQMALTYLLAQGLKSLSQNYRSARGEIDLIMQDGPCIVFVEVRYRRQSRYGSSAESVDRRKQQKILLTAQDFLQKHPRWQNQPCRFDVIACSPGTGDTRLEWIRNAFET